jgi:hypothetical protein
MIDYTTLLLLWIEGFSCKWYEEFQYFTPLDISQHMTKFQTMLCPSYLSFRQEMLELLAVSHSFVKVLGELNTVWKILDCSVINILQHNM